jgi:polyisoprenoid-binding protein YceI
MDPTPRTSFVHRFRWLIAGVVALLLAVTVGPYVYIHFIKEDAPERQTVDDVLGSTTTIAGDGSTTTVPGATAADGIDGTWTVSEGSSVGYRVQENLFGQSAEAVGTTSDVTGSVTISGTTVSEASFEADLTTVQSDESRRDGQFQGRIMETSQFPTATFAITEPIDLGSVPADGQTITVEATGELTLHNVTRPVTIELHAKRAGDTFAVDGSLPVTFSDYGIDNPSGGPANVGDDGALEVLLVFTR